MVVIVYGTTGELIKLLPLLKGMNRESFITVCTYQQPQQLKKLQKEAKIDTPDIKIGQNENAPDLEKLTSVPFWFLRVWVGFFRNSRAIKKRLEASGSKNNLLLVHGDTTTTLLGTIMGKFLGLRVAHVEAGLRSYNWRHPFPEELNRIYTSKFARLHFAPGDIPVENLHKAKTKGDIINTQYNTVLDSLRLAKSDNSFLQKNLPKKYCLVSIHRNELVAQPKELERILRQIRDFSEDIPIIFLDHPITKERLSNLGLDSILEHENITRMPKQSYFSFIQLLTKAACVITDSGGLQEETAYLGIPCLVHRKATERQEGLGLNVVLSYYDSKIVEDFCSNYQNYQTQGVAKKISPTKIILQELLVEGYLAE